MSVMDSHLRKGLSSAQVYTLQTPSVVQSKLQEGIHIANRYIRGRARDSPFSRRRWRRTSDSGHQPETLSSQEGILDDREGMLGCQLGNREPMVLPPRGWIHIRYRLCLIGLDECNERDDPKDHEIVPVTTIICLPNTPPHTGSLHCNADIFSREVTFASPGQTSVLGVGVGDRYSVLQTP